jgi:hypothetical protein
LGAVSAEPRWQVAGEARPCLSARRQAPWAARAPPTSTESRFSRVTMLLVRGSAVLPMCCSSHWTATPAAWKTFLAASAISGPMPSPDGVGVEGGGGVSWGLACLEAAGGWGAPGGCAAAARACSAGG